MERESSVVDHRSDLLKQYSGAVAWAVEQQGGIHTRVNLVAAAFTRNKRGPFQVHMTLHTHGGTVVREWVSRKGQFDRDLHFTLGEVFEVGNGFEGYVEVIATSPNQDLRTQHYNELWFDYFSDDGRVHLVLPTIQFYGSVKRTLGGQSQIWPGLTATEIFRPAVCSINPYQETIDFTFSAVAPDGSSISSEPLTLAPKSQRRWEIDEWIPGLRDFLAPHGGIGNLLISSTHKMVCYFLMENVRTGTITGADHLAWFYGENF